MSLAARTNQAGQLVVTMLPLHSGQKRVVANLGKKNLLRCGRRFGKTTLLEETFAARAIERHRAIGWFTPEYKLMTPTYHRLVRRHGHAILKSSLTQGLIEFVGGGLMEFWTLDNEDAGRSRAYDDAVVDEASLKKKGLKEIVEQAIEPTLIDRDGTLTLAGTPKGIDDESFFYVAANDHSLGYRQMHAPTWLNPNLARTAVERLMLDHPPLVFEQEFAAQFVDWSGAAFFSLDNLTLHGMPVDYPKVCDGVIAFIDTATKTGKEHDGTAMLIVAFRRFPFRQVWLLDWDLRQIEGSLLVQWLPSVFDRLEYWAKRCRARGGSAGAMIEDKSSGMILLQQARRLNKKVRAMPEALTAVGKDERAINVSGYVWRNMVKFTPEAYDKVVNYKGVTKNHLKSQVTGYRVANKEMTEDDCLDTFTYGVAVTCGDAYGF